MSNKSIFTYKEYEEAKKYLEGAKIEKQYKDDVEINTLWRTSDGYLFYEHESLLEGRDDEYILELMQEPVSA